MDVYDDQMVGLLRRGEECVSKGLALCADTYDALNRASNHLGQKANEVAQCLRRRIFETNTALRELHHQYLEVCRGIRQMDYFPHFQSSASYPSIYSISSHSFIDGKDEGETSSGHLRISILTSLQDSPEEALRDTHRDARAASMSREC